MANPSRNSELFELSTPYSTFSPFEQETRSRSRPQLWNKDSFESFNTIPNKTSYSSYDPINRQDEDTPSFGRHYAGAAAAAGAGASSPAVLQPGQIGKFGVDLVIEVTVCTFAVLVAAPFLWLAIEMARYHDQEVTQSDTDYIQQATRTVSTFFTILFAAVLGSTLKRFATWRLEKGIQLGLLEQLMQSRTVFAAVTTQLALRPVNLTALALLLCWTFSPLGSQASLRLISIGIQTTTNSSLVSYVDTITNNVFDSVSGVVSLRTSLKPTYVSSMLGPPNIKNGSMDLWGNVKIPRLIPDAEKDEDGWTDLTLQNITEGSYSALVGLPVNGLAHQNATLVVETTYMNLDCIRPNQDALVDINFNVSAPNGTFMGPNTTLTPSAESGIYPEWQIALDQFVSNGRYFYGYPELFVNDTDNSIPQATLLWQTRGPWQSRCKINQVYVESNVSCNSVPSSPIPLCSVIRQRESPNRHTPSTITTFSFPSVLQNAGSEWIFATDPLSSSGYSSLAEYYLVNTTANFVLAGNGRNYADYSNVTAEEFSQRLMQLMNTFILASQTSADIMAYSLNHRNTTATYFDNRNVYICAWGWLSVYCAAIAVMLGAALVSIWCSFQTTIPDVLSYCSSLTRDSKFFGDSARGGSTLNGVDRTKILQNVELKLGEVSDQNGQYLAVAPPEYVRPLKPGFLYA